MPTKLRTRLILLLSGLAAIGILGQGCRGCGDKNAAGKAALAFVPKDAALVIIGPSAKLTTEYSDTLLKKLKGTMVDGLVTQARTQAKEQLKFDPLDIEAWKKSGFDIDAQPIIFVHGSNVLGQQGKGAAGVVYATTDSSKADKALRALLKSVLGDRVAFTEGTANSVKATIAKANIEGRPFEFGWAISSKHLILALTGEQSGKLPETLAGFIKQKTSILDNEQFKRAKERAGEESEALVYMDINGLGTAMGAFPGKLPVERVTIGYRRKSGLHFGVFVDLRQDIAPKVAQLTKVGNKAEHLERFVDHNAMGLARLALNTTKAFFQLNELLPPPNAEKLKGTLEEVRRSFGIDIEKSILPLLAGHFAFAGFPAGDTAATQQSPLGAFASGAVMVQLTDGDKGSAILADVMKRLGEKGLQPGTVTVEGQTIYLLKPSPGSTEAAIGVAKNVLLLGTPPIVSQAVRHIKKGGADKTLVSQLRPKSIRELFESSEGLIFYQNLGAVRKGLAGALGGPMSMMLAPLTKVIEDIQSASGQIRSTDKGASIEAHLSLHTGS